MKKYCIAIFLVFSIVFGNAGLTSIPAGGISGDPVHKTVGFSASDINLPHQEIEHGYTNGNHAAPGTQGFQKLPVYLAIHAITGIISPVFSSLPGYADIELYDNSYLVHNYPSHNFW